MANANFAALLDRRSNEIEKPKPLPVGTYTFAVGNHTFDESSQKKTPYIKFEIFPRSSGPDVDQDLLAEVKNWQEKTMGATFYLTEDALWRLNEFLEQCGIPVDERTLAERIPETRGTMVNGYVHHETNDKNEPYARVEQFSPVE